MKKTITIKLLFGLSLERLIDLYSEDLNITREEAVLLKAKVVLDWAVKNQFATIVEEGVRFDSMREELLEAAGTYAKDHGDPECSDPECESCKEIAHHLRLAYLCGISAISSIMCAMDGAPDLTPSKVQQAVREAVEKECKDHPEFE